MGAKKLVMIAGPAGVGKTAVCKVLFGQIEGCAWLDADWCWMVNPYIGKTTEQKRYAEGAFGYLLNGYLADDNTKVILFCWLMHSDFMFDLVTDRLDGAGYDLVKIALICTDRTIYVERMKKDGRRQEQIAQDVDMAQFARLDAHVIDVAHMSVAEVAARITDIARIG